MEDAIAWDAEFKVDDLDYSSDFDLQGQWMETEHEIKTSEIPASIQAILDQEFSDFKIDEAKITEKLQANSMRLPLKKVRRMGIDF